MAEFSLHNRSGMIKAAAALPTGDAARRELLALLVQASSMPEQFEIGQKFTYRGKPIAVVGGADSWEAGMGRVGPGEVYTVTEAKYLPNGKLDVLFISGTLTFVYGGGEPDQVKSGKWLASDRRGGVSKRWLKAMLASSWA